MLRLLFCCDLPMFMVYMPVFVLCCGDSYLHAIFMLVAPVCLSFPTPCDCYSFISFSF